MRIDRSTADVLKLAVLVDESNSNNRYFTTVQDIHDKRECRDCAIYDLSLDEVNLNFYCTTFKFLLWHPNPKEIENLELVDKLIGDKPELGALGTFLDKLGYVYCIDDTDGFPLVLDY